MVKHTQTIRRKLPTNCLRVFDHFVKLVVKGLKRTQKSEQNLGSKSKEQEFFSTEWSFLEKIPAVI